jgi:hypothetical protein
MLSTAPRDDGSSQPSALDARYIPEGGIGAGTWFLIGGMDCR